MKKEKQQEQKTPTSDYINESSKDYSIYVAQSRAIPRVADGLKDGPRKALWLLKSKTEKIKTVSLAGEMISSGLYLHGDASAAGAISMLAAPYVNNVPLIEGIGAFGTRVAPVEGIGAPRYTYVKKNKASETLLYQDLDVVPLRENYDGSNVEPEHFLPLIPLVLLNGVEGLAVGWSTNILPRNLKKLIAATQQALDGKEVKGLEPSFDYLNVVVNGLEPNVWEFRGRVDIVDASSVLIRELPPGLNLENFKKRLNKMEDEEKIYSYVDKSTDQIHIQVKFKRGMIKDWDENNAIDFFKLRERATERIVVIDWNGKSIRQYENPETVVKEFVQWRLQWYTKRYQKMFDDDSYELKYWKGIEACFADKLPARLIKKANKEEVMTDVKSITTKIGLDADQIDKIVSLPTFKWANDFLVTVQENITSLESNIAKYDDLLKSPKKIKQIYSDELESLKKLK